MARRMNRYGTLAVVRFGVGEVLALTPDQAAPRAAMLEDAGKGLWRVTGSVEFKAGEEIGLKPDAPLSRYLEERLQPLRANRSKLPDDAGHDKDDAGQDEGDADAGLPPEILTSIRRTAVKQGIGEGGSPSLDGVNAGLALAGIGRVLTASELALAWAGIRAADAGPEDTGGDGGDDGRD